jgi:zinc transport system substrate-binding protein
MPQYTRRRLVATGIGFTTIGSLAGCTSTDAGSTGSTGERPVAQSSFFVFGDFATQVVGDAATAETLVPVGQHGHGWEPGPDIQGEILESDLFVYGTDGFQPWVGDLVASLRDDEADVQMVSVGEEVDLIEGGHEHGSEDDHEHGSEDEHDHEHDHEHESEEHESEDEHDHEHESEDEHDHEHESEEGHGHEHGAMDPHFWLDPQRAAQAVGTLEATFAEMDDENAEVYADNAAAYRNQLEDLDGEIRSTVNDAPKDTLFIAGHDAFQYLEDRYGLRVESLTDLSPDDQPTPRDIERAQEIIDEHGLAHVCADPLEDQTAAEQLVEETDATEILPLTAIPGQTSEWADNGWGYVEIMENVNLNTLETALNA